MSKREETVALEEALHYQVKMNRIYGCEEVTIGFYNNGHGNEIVDFMTMDSKGIVKCYEIKVTLDDLKSSAKLSWYGHYNYLLVTPELYQKVNDWSQHIPKHIGIIVGTGLVSKRKAKKIDLSLEQSMMVKESLIRSMFYKMIRYKDSHSIKKQSYLESRIRQLTREKSHAIEEGTKYRKIVDDYEAYKFLNDGVNVSLEQLAKEERNRYYGRS